MPDDESDLKVYFVLKGPNGTENDFKQTRLLTRNEVAHTWKSFFATTNGDQNSTPLEPGSYVLKVQQKSPAKPGKRKTEVRIRFDVIKAP